jgi:hypothetical protein
MTPEGASKNLGSFHTQTNPAVLYRGKSRLRDAGYLAEFILTQLLELPKDTHRISNRNHNPTLGRAKLTHFSASYNREG